MSKQGGATEPNRHFGEVSFRILKRSQPATMQPIPDILNEGHTERAGSNLQGKILVKEGCILLHT